MQSKISLRRDKKVRSKFILLESKSTLYKNLYRNKLFNYLDVINNFSRLNSNIINLSRVKNKCVLTCRNKGIINKRARLSRIKLKETINKGLLLGFKKYSW